MQRNCLDMITTIYFDEGANFLYSFYLTRGHSFLYKKIEDCTRRIAFFDIIFDLTDLLIHNFSKFVLFISPIVIE